MQYRRVREFMTPNPVCVDAQVLVFEAHRLMREHDIRHLPVFENGTLVGLLSEEDVHLVESLKHVDATGEAVDGAMETEPLVVGPDERLDRVVESMLANHLHSAVVMDGNRLVGVFTHTDALQALLEVLNELERPLSRPELRL